MPKKILIFSLAYYPHVGGAEVAIKEITDRISPSAIEFHMVTLRFGSGQAPEEKIGNVVVHRVGGGSSYLSKISFIPRAALEARRLHREQRFDGLWAMMTYMLFPTVLARIMCVRVPYALTLQDGDPFERVFSRWYILPFRPLLRSGFRCAAVVSAISNYLAGWAKQMGYTGLIEIIPNGADIKRFAGEKIAHDGTILITTSRLVRKNAIDAVIRALRLLPDIKFNILGIGPEEPALKKLARELGVGSRVECAGHVSHADMPPYLHAADIFVRPSRSEGQGASFIEAMAAGLPVIATQEGGIADFLFDAERNPDKAPTGWAVDKDSPEQIAAAVKTILANPETAAQVVENAKKMVGEKYDWDNIAADMRDKVFSRAFT